MKRLLAFTLIFLLCLQPSFAQSVHKSNQSKLSAVKTTISIVYSFGFTDLYSSTDIVGGPSYSGEGFHGFGALISMEVHKNLDIVTGFSYVRNRFERTEAPIGVHQSTYNENINISSIPILVKYHFLKFLYVGGGPVFGINSGDRDINGIGAYTNFGVEYVFKNSLVLSFGPFVRYHGLIPWKDYRLINSGVNFGIGYRL